MTAKKKKKKKKEWLFTQPAPNQEIVIFANRAKPSYHVVTWCSAVSEDKFYNRDWDIKLGNGIYVGPRCFEGGVQFMTGVKDKEFYWLPRSEFVIKGE